MGLARVRVVGDVVAPVAEEDEAVVAQPGEEGADLVEFAGDVGQSAGPGLQRPHGPVQRTQHGPEVVGGAHHVIETLLEFLLKRFQNGGIGHARDLAVDERFPLLRVGGRHDAQDAALATDDSQERVDEVLDGEVPRVQVLADRVHDEGALAHVGADHGHGSPPLSRLGGGVEDAHVHPVRAARLQEREGVRRQPRKLHRVPLAEIEGRRPGEEEPREVRRELGFPVGEDAPEAAANVVDDG